MGGLYLSHHHWEEEVSQAVVRRYEGGMCGWWEIEEELTVDPSALRPEGIA